MKLNVFSRAAKEIILTALAALFLFSLLAVKDAKAANVIEENLANRIAVTQQLNNDFANSKVKLTRLEAEFEANKINTATLFAAMVEHHQLEQAAKRARLELLMQLDNIADTHPRGLMATR